MLLKITWLRLVRGSRSARSVGFELGMYSADNMSPIKNMRCFVGCRTCVVRVIYRLGLYYMSVLRLSIIRLV